MDKEKTTTDNATPGHGVDQEHVENAEHGIPDGMEDAEPTGLPTSDRHQGEIASTKS